MSRFLLRLPARLARSAAAKPTTTAIPLRSFSVTSQPQSDLFGGPAPPRLPPKEQEEFERLQKASTGAFSTPQPRSPPRVNEPGQTTTASTQTTTTRTRPQVNQPGQSKDESSIQETIKVRLEATGQGEELHPDVRRGAAPEFEGEKNPKTGEVGGPKNEPLRWGAKADWSYNGRVTDF
jgi:hypothetical protein